MTIDETYGKFDEECINEYWVTSKELRFSFENIKNIYKSKLSNSDINNISLISAPLYQQVTDWIFENYDIDITIDAIFKNRIYYTITKLTNNGPKRLCGGSPYEPSSAMKTLQEAREVAILKAINIIEHETN